MGVSGHLHTPATLPPGNAPQYPMDRMLGPQSWSGCAGKEKKSLPLPEIKLQSSSL